MKWRAIIGVACFVLPCGAVGCGAGASERGGNDSGPPVAASEDGSAFDAGLDAVATNDVVTASPTDAGSAPDTNCGDTQSDPTNCGTCGHDCFGAACSNGACGPLPYDVIATGQALPAGVAVDDAGVYWIDLGTLEGHGKSAGPYVGGSVMACPKDGCPAGPTPLVSELTQLLMVAGPAPIVAVGGSVYFGAVDSTTFGGEVFSCATGGCAGAGTLLASSYPWAMATNGVSLFWTGGSADSVMECTLDGCAGSPTALYDGPDLTYAITADATNVYWLGTDVNDNLLSCAVGGCEDAATPMANTLAQYAQMTSDATELYFTYPEPIGMGAIMKCAKSGCPGGPTVVASGRSSPLGIAVDATRVYWTEVGNDIVGGGVDLNAGGVYACPLTGCGDTPTVIAAQQDGPEGIAVDDTYVYWTAEGPDGGEVLRSAKP